MTQLENADQPIDLVSLLGEPPLLKGENQHRYAALRAQVEQMIQPKNIVDQMRVQTLTDTMWDELRYKRYEAKTIESAGVSALVALLTPLMNWFHEKAAELAQDYYCTDPKKSEPAAQQVAKHGITEEMIHAKAASIQGAHLALFDRLIANRQTSSRVLLNDQERRVRKAKKSQRRRAQPNAVSPDAGGTVARH